MSKTITKYGQPTFTATISVDANPQPTPRLVWGWQQLDKYAKKEYGVLYDHLNSKQKVELHFNINNGKYDAKDS